MVTVNIFRFFSFDPNSARLDGHFGVLHDHISASIITWVSQKPSKKVKIVKNVMFPAWLPWLRKIFFLFFF